MTSALAQMNKTAVQDCYLVKEFSPLDAPEMAMDYVEGHHNVLREFGVTRAISSSDSAWVRNPKVRVVGLVHEGEIVGGVKLHFGLLGELPFSSNVPTQFLNAIQAEFGRHTAEICGLWLSKRHLKKGLSEVLVRAGVSVWSKLQSEGYLFTFASQYTLSMTMDLGFSVLPVSTERDWMPYPTEEFKSYVLVQDYRCNDMKSYHKEFLSQLSQVDGRMQKVEHGFQFDYEI